MPTARNARGIDIIGYNTSGKSFIGIQVKTLSNRNPVPLGNSLSKIMGDFWIVVNCVSSEPNAYILLPDEIKRLAHKGENGGRVSYWLQPKVYDQEEYKVAWDRIGFGHELMIG